MVQTGKRLFKGYEDYTDVHKLTFDIETTSLTPETGHSFMVGVKDNRGYKKLLTAYGEDGEYSREGEKKMYEDLFQIIHELEPSIIVGYNSENFDWNYIFGRMDRLGMSDTNIRRNKKDNRVTSIDVSCDAIKTKHPMVGLTRKTSDFKNGCRNRRLLPNNNVGL